LIHRKDQETHIEIRVCLWSNVKGQYGKGLMRILLLLIVLLLGGVLTQAQNTLLEGCAAPVVQPRPSDFSTAGLILTAFDGESLWVYDIARATRYPLPETRPCAANCHLSPDMRWFAYMDPLRGVFTRMRINGTERSDLASDASDVLWWDANTILVWTPDHRAWLRSLENLLTPGEQLLHVDDVRAIQPGGRWGLAVGYEQGTFYRYLLNLETRFTPDEQRIRLSPDTAYFNAAAWSPSGSMLAYVGRGALDPQTGIAGAELFLIQPGSAIPQQMTYFSASSGAVRINGYAPGDLSWSPDSRYLAFWVIPLTSADPEATSAAAVLHVLDTTSGELQRYCDFSTSEHTPIAPRLIWSPDATHIAFAGNIPGDDKGVLLLALEVSSGRFIELSDGIYPAWGIAQVYAWGLEP
jgi:hypothetical protein